MAAKRKRNQVTNSESQKDFFDFENLKKADRLKLLMRILENMDVESRKKFFKNMLPFVLADSELTEATFKNNTGKQDVRKNEPIEITEYEKQLINKIAGHMKELQLLVDFEDLLGNP